MPNLEVDYSARDSQFYSELVAQLQNEVAELKSENKLLKDKQTVDQVRARMMEPYANKVFNLCAWYCVIVGVIIFACAEKSNGIELSDTVLSVIAGSTAVSVIGLVGIVVTGLFGPKNP